MDCTAKAQRYNNFLLHILYLPIMLVSAIAFLTMNLILLPIGFSWSLFFKINILMNDLKGSKSKNLIEVLVYALLGPFMMLCSQFTDFYYFMRHLYMSNNEKLTTYRA